MTQEIVEGATRIWDTQEVREYLKCFTYAILPNDTG